MVAFNAFARSANEQLIDSLETLLPKLGQDTQKVEVLFRLSWYYIPIDPQRSTVYGEDALALAEQLNDQKGKAKTLNTLGSVAWAKGAYQEAEQYHLKALELCQQMGNKEGEASNRGNLANIYIQQGDFFKALDNLEAAKDAYNALGQQQLVAQVLGNMGSIYSYIGDNTTAMSLFWESVKIYDALGKKAESGTTLINIGLIQYKLGDVDKAQATFERSLVLMEELNHKRGISDAYSYLGLIEADKGNFTEALGHQQHALEIAQEVGYKTGIGKAYTNMGNIYVDQDNIKQAVDYFQQALAIQQEIGNANGIIENLMNMGMAQLKAQQLHTALGLLEQALQQARQIQNKDLMKEAYQKLATVQEALGHYDQSLLYYKQYTDMKDSLYGEETKKQLLEMEVRYESEKKQLVIENLDQKNALNEIKLENSAMQNYALAGGLSLVLLIAFVLFRSNQTKQKTNTTLAQKNEEIEQQKASLADALDQLSIANSTKDKLFSIIGHDLRSPLTHIRMGLDMVRNKKIKPEELEAVVSLLQKDANHTFELLDNLLNWSLLQQEGIQYQPEEQDLKQLVDQNVQLFRGAAEAKGVALHQELKESVIAYCDKNMINIVVRNLLSNAIKFTPKGGEVHIAAAQLSHQVQLTIRDSGVGMAKQDMANLFNRDTHHSTFGTNREKGAGLGLVLCKDFVERNKGSIEVRSTEGTGSTFIVTLPLKS